MALAPLATSGDLSARGITISQPTRATTLLAVASAVVRGAAASPILRKTSIVDLTVYGEQFLDLPGKPVVSVNSVTIDEHAATGWKLVAGGQLWRRIPWGCAHEPTIVTVELTHGFTEVPADLVNLVCNLVAAGNKVIEDGDTFDPRVVAERIDDYSVTYAQGAEAVADVMSLPVGSRRALRRRFGGGARMIEYRA